MLSIDSSFIEQKYTLPALFFTLKGNKKSEEIISELSDLIGNECACIVFEDPEDIRETFLNGQRSDAAVVLFDGLLYGEFTPRSPMRQEDRKVIPSWAQAVWGIQVSPKCTRIKGCAMQLRADFRNNFFHRLNQGNFPWGLPKKKESGPRHIKLPDHIESVLKSLNSDSAPNLSKIIADTERAVEIPVGSKISWIRVPASPIGIERAYLQKVTDALDRFQEIGTELVRYDEQIHELLLAGVDIPPDTRLRNLYLFPPSKKFSVARPDLHFTGSALFASENDEMPGGLPEAVHIDNAYGLHQEEWKETFSWLTENGPLLFLVSHEWSGCYLAEMEWLAGHMKEKGYPTFFVTTEDLSLLNVTEQGVFFNAERIGTIWRQFPIFETRGKLTDIVEAAASGLVRVIPEFGHFGNKSWFSIFRTHETFFRTHLNGETFHVLEEVLPDSHLVIPWDVKTSFPMKVEDLRIDSLEQLRRLAESERDKLVIKIAGANALSARSYGVFMGHGIKEKDWADWIDTRVKENQPFIVQQKLTTGIVEMPVRNTAQKRDEIFRCRVLVRPWVVNGEIISGIATAVPYTTERVHGMVDMAMSPISLY